ncbi:MAG: hypothetical protein JWM68_943 [Verrucomicrobiales bacterium]|nr:hypothetical protein [Verrucomicrobiales bacterium]
MQAQEIEPKLWREFCENFSALNRGSMMSVEQVGFNGRKDEIARDIPFEKMTLDTTDACNDIISITLGESGQRSLTHQVIEPIHVRVKQNGDGQKVLQVEAESGMTLIHFHSGRVPELVPNMKHYKGDRIAMDRDDRRFSIPS